MDQPALWLGSTYAAAKFVIALWAAQLSLAALDRRRATLGWHITLSALAVIASFWAMPAITQLSWWRGVWWVNSLLSAAVLVDCVRRWIATEGATFPSWRVHWMLAWSGLVISAVASAAALTTELPPSAWLRVGAIVQMFCSTWLLGVTAAISLELTLGAIGPGLLGLRWRVLVWVSSLLACAQLALCASLILALPNADSPQQAILPIVFAVVLMIVSYIAWSLPRRMAALARIGEMQGQASLAVAAWLAVICLAIECGLPSAWPWTLYGQSSTGAAALAIVKHERSATHSR